MKKGSIGRLVAFLVSAGLLILLTIAFSIPLDSSAPPLGKLLFPGGGLWAVPDGYPQSEAYQIDGLRDNVTVIRDQWGIPHIYGSSQNDIAFAMGYVQAEDRLFFMDLVRRFASGRLSEIVGKGALGVDVLSKVKLLEVSAEKMYRDIAQSNDATDQQFYQYVENYVQGINHYVETHPNDLPLEFRLLDYQFEPWTGVDCMTIAFYMMEAGFGYWDIERLAVLSAMMERFGQSEGKEEFESLFGNPAKGKFLPFQIPTNPGYGNIPESESVRRSLKGNTGEEEILSGDSVATAFAGLMRMIESVPLEDLRKKMAEFSGSNGWAVHGSRSTLGKPLLASDSHEGWSLPNVYYEAHVIDRSSDYNFYGYYVPGGAGVPVYGHSRYVAYGMTRCQFDQTDWYYYEKAGDDHYILDGIRKPFEPPVESVINIKGSDPLTIKVRQTVHGPVFSDLGKHAPGAFANLPENMKDVVIAARWLVHESPKVKDLGISLLEMSQARNLDEFRLAVKKFVAPASNISYADVEGRIYMHSTGDYPVRDNSGLPDWHLGNGVLPYNGSKGEGEWKEIVAFDELPHATDPEQGYLVSSNQIVAGPEYFKKYQGQFRYNHGYRARRVIEMLKGNDKISIEDMKAIQTDIISLKARDFLPHLLKLLSESEDLTPKQQKAFGLLSSWPWDMDKDKVAPAIFSTWVAFLYEDVFRDDWDAMGLKTRLQPDYPILEKLIRTDPNSIWFDDLETEKVEKADDMILSAFDKTLSTLEEHFQSDDMEQWKWGELHRLVFEHMSGSLSALNYGPVPISGSYETVSAPRAKLIRDGIFKPKRVDHGSHHRMVVDFGNIDNSKSVLPGGNSGLTTMGSPVDQFDLFINGEYHSEYFSASTPQILREQAGEVLSTLEFKPLK